MRDKKGASPVPDVYLREAYQRSRIGYKIEVWGRPEFFFPCQYERKKKGEAIQSRVEKAMVICGGFSGRDKTEKEETPAMQRRGKAKALWCAHGDASAGRTWNPRQRIHVHTYM